MSTQDNHTQRWGKLEDSYDKSELCEGNQSSTLNLMNENTKIIGQQKRYKHEKPTELLSSSFCHSITSTFAFSL